MKNLSNLILKTLLAWAVLTPICKAGMLSPYKLDVGLELVDGTYRYSNTNSQAYLNLGLNVADALYFDTLIRGYTGDRLYTEFQWELGAAQRDVDFYIQGTRGQGITMLSNSLAVGVRFKLINKKKELLY